MRAQSTSWLRRIGVASIFAIPALHPALIPYIGVPSHLLWWVHVLPVALFTFTYGRFAAVASLVASTGMVAGGEWLFGAGYGQTASPQTIIALSVALFLTNLLVVAFAMYARDVSGRYRLLFEHVGIGVIRLGPDGRILGANPAALDLLGVGRACIGCLPEEVIRAKGLLSLDHLEARGGWTGQVEVGPPSAGRSIHAFLAAATDADGRGSQILLADRSTEAMHEQEIERQSKLAALGEALAGVAHELNNPLTAILAHAQLGTMTEDPVEHGEMFTIIEHESERMRDIVRELLGFSRRAESDECTNLDQVLERMARVQRIALGKGIRIDEDFDWPWPVRASGVKIEQIVLNLMSNAAYSVRQNRGRVIGLSTRRVGDVVEVEVRDDGAGIAPDILDRLFEPFATTKPEGEGTGLGLAISRRLARAWGGDLTARNLESGGAAFTLRVRVPAEALELQQRIA